MTRDWNKDLRSNFVKSKTIFIHDNFDQDIVSYVLPSFDQLIEEENE